MTPEYRQGWAEGVAALLRALIGEDSGGFLPAELGIKDKDGKADDWVSVGWVFECFAKVKDDPQEAILPPARREVRA